jgi:hypothetical protein
MNAGTHTNGELGRDSAGLGRRFKPNHSQTEQSEGRKNRCKSHLHGIHRRGVARSDDRIWRWGDGANHNKQKHGRCEKSD